MTTEKKLEIHAQLTNKLTNARQFYADNPTSSKIATIILTRDLTIQVHEYDVLKREGEQCVHDSCECYLRLLETISTPYWEISCFDRNNPNGMVDGNHLTAEDDRELNNALESALEQREHFYIERVKVFGMSALPRRAEDGLREIATATIAGE